MGFAGWPRAVAEIETRGGPLRINVTVADTPERQAQGLMFVRTLDADEGMWFPQHPPRVMRMWMKNTLVPLDMLFIDARGRVACIHAAAEPLSVALRHCPARVSGVLEINGGQARQYGVGIGSRIALGTARAP